MSVAVDGTKIWQPEAERVQNVILKLASGHAACEVCPTLEPPDHLSYLPLELFTSGQREAFEHGDDGIFAPWPEIGSRAFMRACGANPDGFTQSGDWIILRPGRYRYRVRETGGINVTMVLSEYLACEVTWE